MPQNDPDPFASIPPISIVAAVNDDNEDATPVRDQRRGSFSVPHTVQANGAAGVGAAVQRFYEKAAAGRTGQAR